MNRVLGDISNSALSILFLIFLLGTAHAKDVVYVSLGTAGEVQIIDPAQDRVVGVLKQTPDVHGLAVTPNGKFIVAGSLAEPNRLPTKNSEVQPGQEASQYAATVRQPIEKKRKSSFVTIVRTEDGAIVRRIKVPGSVRHIAITPNGRFAIATHPNSYAVTVIDLQKVKLIRTIRTGTHPNYVAIDPKGEWAYVSNSDSNNISEIDLESWQVRREFLTQDGPEHMVLSPDGDTLYVCNGRAGTVSEITVRSGVVTATHEIGEALHGLDLSNDGRTLFVVARRQNKVLSIDLNSKRLRSAMLPSAPYHLSTIKRTGKLYISSATEPVIWVLRQKNLELLRTIRINGIGHQMIFVPPT
jgi:DNA-binding beta-propeller fold protein YncE